MPSSAVSISSLGDPSHLSAAPSPAPSPAPPFGPTSSLTRRLNNRLSEIQRSDSFRSQNSDASSASDSKRVSFNNDVKVKRIPNKSKLAQPQDNNLQVVSSNNQQFTDFKTEAPPSDPKEIEQEAERILQQLSLVECSVSSLAPSTLNSGLKPPPPQPPPAQVFQSSDTEAGGSIRRSRAGSLDFASSNPLYGLHALNNLDIAVNGKEVNSMPSYREIRRRGLDGSGGSDDNSSVAIDRYDGIPPPPKPPRKAPSTSPPSLRRSDPAMTHYARPATVSSPSHVDHLLSRDEKLRKRFVDSNNDDSAIASGGDGGGTDDASGSNPSYRFTGPPPVRHRSSPPSSASPSRTCMTDSEILRSPTEVLYAVSDKRRIRDSGDMKSVQSASVQTMRSELRQNPPGYFAKNPNRPSRNSSREDLLTDDASYVSSSTRRSTSLQQPQRRTPSYSGSKYGNHIARSLERFLDGDDKENAFKTRIQVISPERGPSPDPNRRKPYKTMINTATDNIQYRVDSIENLRYLDYYKQSKDDGNEHYKVPKNKGPVIEDYYLRQQQQQQLMQQQSQRRRQMYRSNEDSDFSSNSYVPQQHRTTNGTRTQFTSTGLVKNADSRRYRQTGSAREMDREGRSIRREGRHYSGCSTSPDREGSPERYARPIVNPSNGNYPYRMPAMTTSPDVSPTRPPRSRSSPIRDLGRVNGQLMPSRREVDDIPRIKNGSSSLSREASMLKQVAPRRRERPDSGEDRLARFTEYRGEDVVDNGRRPSITDQQVSDRERGRSLPPGATIESMRDFYKSSQFKSMYALPPSPNRPAPVLERSQSRRPTRVSISEGEVTDDANGMPMERPEPVRPVRMGPGVPRPSTKRPAPSPPGMVNGVTSSNVRRVVSSDRESVRTVPRESIRRVGPQRRVVAAGRRGSSVDGLDSSFSESEGINCETDQDKQPMGEFGRRWSAHQSDIDSDYRRELATSGNGNGLHQEARSRDGGSSSILVKSRVNGSKTNVRNGLEDPDSIMRDVDDDDDQVFSDRSQANNVSSAREEERRKVLEIEEERIRLEREAQLRRSGAPGVVNGTANRSGRTAHVHAAALRRGGHRGNSMASADAEIQYGTGSAQPGAAKISRYDQYRSNSRVRRTASNANNSVNTAAAVGGVRREIVNHRKKLPGGSLTSSVNSSESERGSHAGQSAVSRAATDASRRSVYLHAAAVVDIPSASERPSRAQSADHQPSAPISSAASTSNLKNSKKISRSISLLAPWKPRNYKDKFEVIHYDNRNLYANPATTVTVGPSGATSTASGPASGKPPRPPVPPVTRHRGPDKKSASSTDLLRDTQPQQAVPQQPSSASVLERRAQTLQRPPSKVSRSVSMPKDSRLAGWFKKRKRS